MKTWKFSHKYFGTFFLLKKKLKTCNTGPSFMLSNNQQPSGAEDKLLPVLHRHDLSLLPQSPFSSGSSTWPLPHSGGRCLFWPPQGLWDMPWMLRWTSDTGVTHDCGQAGGSIFLCRGDWQPRSEAHAWAVMASEMTPGSPKGKH